MDNSIYGSNDRALLAEKVAAQKQAFLTELPISVARRKQRLKTALNCLLGYESYYTRLISDDFGHRSAETTLFADITSSATALKDAIGNVGKWAKPQRRRLPFPFGLLGARAEILPQPKGVVGLITPWNFPLAMVFVPLAQMLAAGNRVFIKPSEHTPKTSAFLADVFQRHFPGGEVQVIPGGVETSQAFAAQKWDHLMFTGAPAVGRLIMKAASEHLTPVTLELGGKSPVVVGEKADIAMAAERVATMKHMNSGQICLAPDYINIPEKYLDDFVRLYEQSVTQMYPTMIKNTQYSSIINDRHLERLEIYIKDAREKGGEIHLINPAREDFDMQVEGRKMPSVLVLNAKDTMLVMQEEIFGPILPVRPYKHLSEVIDYINKRDKPLALYYFGSDKTEQYEILQNTTSGGVTVNDVLWHGAHDSLPFGGVGNSGMGRYHGYEGFMEFSHMKPVLYHPQFSIGRLLGIVPPYSKRLKYMVKFQLWR